MRAAAKKRAEPSVKQRQTTVRLDGVDKMIIDDIQAETDLSQSAILHRAIELLQRERLSLRLQADFEAMATDKKAMKAYKEESAQWDKASADGLRTK